MIDALIVFVLVEIAAALGFLLGVFYASDKTTPPPAAGLR